MAENVFNTEAWLIIAVSLLFLSLFLNWRIGRRKDRTIKNPLGNVVELKKVKSQTKWYTEAQMQEKEEANAWLRNHITNSNENHKWMMDNWDKKVAECNELREQMNHYKKELEKVQELYYKCQNKIA